MKVLMLTPYLPYPLLTGGQTRSYNLIKRLSALGHQITLFCLIKEAEEKKYVGELEKFCKEVKVFTRPQRPWTLSNVIKTGLSLYPFLVIRNWASGEKIAIGDLIQREKFDLIHAETFYVMPHIPHTNIPILLVEQTIEHLVYRHFAEQTHLFLRPFLYFDVMKMKYWELKYWEKAKKVVAMSEEDKIKMLEEVEHLNVDIVPNGVDSEYFGKKITDKLEDPTILYLGNFTWLQNREAVDVLVRRVWPAVKKGVSNAKLWIVGKNAQEFFRHLKSEDIDVGEIEDARVAYQKASVLVAPIYGGGGTRYKNLESFASGLPVVTTSIGIGGTEAKDNQEVIIRDKPEDLAQATIELLQNPNLYRKLAENARSMVSKKYDWNPIAKKLSQIYEELGAGL